MADRLDILLGILLDKAAQKDVERGLDDIQKTLEGMDDLQLTKLSAELEAIGHAAEILEDDLAAAREEAGKLAQTGEQLGRISTMVAAAGAAIVGGIALSAGQYVSFVEKAGIKGDETAERWVAASKRVQNAQLNLGQASAQALLPIYEKAAELATKAAAFVDKNPDLVQAALNTGLVVATLGAVGAAVAKGIKIYADFKYLAATAEYSLATTRFQAAVREYLAGSVLPKGAGGAAAAGGGALAGAAKTLGTVTLLASAVIIGANAGAAIGNALGKLVYGENYKKQDFKDAALTAARLPVTGIAIFANKLTELDGKLGEEGAALTETISKYDEFIKNLLGISSATDSATDGLRDFQQEATNAQATDAFIQYRQQEQQAEEQYMAQRAQIVEQGAQQIAQIEANYSRQRASLIEQFAASSSQAVSNFQFQQRQAAEQFAFSEANAVRDFNERRAEQREEYQRNEERSREDHLREMRKLEEDHNDRTRDLVAARDALGLVREKRDYERKKRDAEEEYRTERQRRRQDFQRQQKDQEEQFQQDRARRRQEFAFRQQQAAEQFARQQALAQQQFEERLAKLDEEHKLELAQSRQQTAQRLRELQEQNIREQQLRRNAFFDILRDLDANLLNERNLRVQYYAQMQRDLMSFLGSASPGSNLPGYGETHAAGGYGPGIVGAGEFVASRSTTRQLEGLVGGRLTQGAMQTIANRSSNTINMEFPGGLVTVKDVAGMLEKSNADLLRGLVRGLA